MCKVLIAEDDGVLRMYLAQDLRSQGYETTEARNGNELLEKFEEEKPELIITDLEMPEISGEDAIKIIRSKDKEVKIIVLTVHEEKHLLDALLDDVDDYLLKRPENSRRILERIKIILSGSPVDMPKYLVEIINRKDEKNLTPTELKLVRYIKKGITKPSEIADKEFKSVHTIKKEFQNLRFKLGTSNLIQSAKGIYC